MAKKKFKKLILMWGVVSLIGSTCIVSTKALERDKYFNMNRFFAKKLSNEENFQGQADGLIDETDRTNSYAWAMAESKEYIYIGINRNFLHGVVQQAVGDNKLADLLTNTIFKGDVETENIDYTGKIVRYNKNTNKMEIVYSSEIAEDGNPYETSYRSALTFKGKEEDSPSVYIGSSFGKKYSRILKFKENYNIETDKPEVVFETASGNTSLRALCEHNGKMYVGSMIVNEDLRILESDSPSKDNWKAIANWDDFNNIPNLDSQSSGFGGISDLISYNGYLYATIGSGSKTEKNETGFMVYKGKEVGVGEPGANESGWKWEMIVGPNGKYPLGMGNYQYVMGTPFKYTASDGKEYVYVGTFSNIMAAIINSLSLDYSLMYETMMKPTQLYRFDENDNWEMVVGTPGENDILKGRIGNYKAGFVDPLENKNYSTNQYVWRMEEYNGKLFASTYDSSTLYDYFVPDKIENAKNQEEAIIRTLLEYSEIINGKKSKETEKIVSLLEEKPAKFRLQEEENKEIRLISEYSTGEEDLPSDYINNILTGAEMELTEDMLEELKPLLKDEEVKKAADIINSIDWNHIKEVFSQEVMDKINKVVKENPKSNDETYTEYFNSIYDELAKAVDDEIIDEIKNIVEKLDKYVDEINKLIEKIKDYINSSEIKKQYEYITKLQKIFEESNKGFGLYVSDDGVNFSCLNENGFNDKYNYGLRTFVSTREGLFIGTANPFYGAQLWKLNEKSTKLQSIILNDGYIPLEFNKNKNNYEVTVDNKVDKVIVKAITEDLSSKATYDEEKELSVGLNLIEIKVTNIDNEESVYKININRKSDDKEEKPNEEDNNENEKPNKEDDKHQNKPSEILPQTGGINSNVLILIGCLFSLIGGYFLNFRRKS
ncbi:cadherin-like beta sandwich domain-containing protein [Clostridium nigeriense]|uniref:cadherin-like beta sandwich domain-containing protein n=1 Tax=Clostridium nigeriense TaxID=1805470 RepID=UPI00082C7E8F|nr:cadherin-like beta sandwich domain-containing protein [Clostridium nigeriense]